MNFHQNALQEQEVEAEGEGLPAYDLHYLQNVMCQEADEVVC